MSNVFDIFDTFLWSQISMCFKNLVFVVRVSADFYSSILSNSMRLSINIRSTYSGVRLSTGTIYGRLELTHANECVRDQVWAHIRSPIRIFIEWFLSYKSSVELFVLNLDRLRAQPLIWVMLFCITILMFCFLLTLLTYRSGISCMS